MISYLTPDHTDAMESVVFLHHLHCLISDAAHVVRFSKTR